MAVVGAYLLYRGDDVLLRFTALVNGSVTAWTTQWTLRLAETSPDPPLLQIAGTIVDAGSVSTPGKFEVAITRAQTSALAARFGAQSYHASFKRTNAGFADTLHKGNVSLEYEILTPK